MKRIICIGNRYAPADASGPKVHDCLLERVLPRDVELIDGGLAGLNLLRLMEGAQRVVFVDRIDGFGQPDEILVLKGADVAAEAEGRYDHSAGLAYLLRVLPKVCEGAVPEVLLIGIEGQATEAAVNEAATVALQVAEGGRAMASGPTSRIETEEWNENKNW